MFYHALTGGNTPTEDLSPVLLWENSNPTAEFAPQTVSLDLTDYAGVIIEFRLKTDSTKINTRLYAKKNEDVDSNFGAGSYYTKGDSNAARGVIVTNTGVEFAEGYGNMTLNNRICIPITIYGVKEYVVEPIDSVTAEQKFFQASSNQTIYTLEKDYDLLMIDGSDSNSFIGYLNEGNFDEILSGEIYKFAPTTKRSWVKGAKAGFKYEVAYADMNFNFTGLIYNK